MIWLILLLAIVLRVIGLDQSLWLDEAVNVLAAKRLNLFTYVAQYSIGDFHPPGYFFLLWIWTRLFGFSEVAVRFPSVILGSLTVLFVYLIGKDLFNKKVALLAAFFLAIAPLHIYYSQEARMYSFSAFSVTLSFYSFIRLLNNKKTSFLGYVFSLILVLYSDYVAYFVIPAQIIYLFIEKREYLPKVLTAIFCSSIGLLPWLIIFPQQLASGKEAALNIPNWKKVVGGADLKTLGLIFAKTILGRVSIFNKIIYGLVVSFSGLLYGLILFKGLKKLETSGKLLFCWVFISLGLAFLFSFYIPILSYFRVIFVLPGLYLLLAQGIFSLPKVFIKPSIIILSTISILFLSFYYLNPDFQRENWRLASSSIVGLLDSRSVIIFEDYNIPAPFSYYQEFKDSYKPGLRAVPAKSLEDIIDINSFKNDVKTIYYFEYLVDVFDPQKFLEKKIQLSGYTKKDVFNFSGVGLVTQYTKL